MDFVNIWISLVGLVIIIYVILDGFSLGTGILFLTAPDEAQRDTIMGAIAPVWDANQTWIVFGGGALFAAFPTTYSVIFSALYVPLLTFLFGLIFRGVAFEFRANAKRKGFWDRAFSWGSIIAAFAQGVTLGAYITGIKTVHGEFAGGTFDWCTPFSLMVGVALVFGYALLGAGYLIMKTEGAVKIRAYRQAFRAVIIVGVFIVLVTVWTPFINPGIVDRWFSVPRIYFIWVFPLIGAFSFFSVLVSLKRRKEIWPFLYSVMLFISAYAGVETAAYPYAVLPDITIMQAAAQKETLVFTLWGVALVLPVVLAYTIYSYWVFRGKVREGAGYH
jgi:cytochrome d ubiquinol oxidase subunit II